MYNDLFWKADFYTLKKQSIFPQIYSILKSKPALLNRTKSTGQIKQRFPNSENLLRVTNMSDVNGDTFTSVSELCSPCCFQELVLLVFTWVEINTPVRAQNFVYFVFLAKICRNLENTSIFQNFQSFSLDLVFNLTSNISTSSPRKTAILTIRIITLRQDSYVFSVK